MSRISPDEPNDFEPPRAGIGVRVDPFGGDPTEAEIIRHAHLGHEASIKSIGSLYYLGAILQAFSLALWLAGGRPELVAPGVPPETAQMLWTLRPLFRALSVVVQFGLGHGLIHLQAWARWTVLALTILGLIVVPLGALGVMMSNALIAAVVLLIGEGILGYVAYLLVSPRGGVVFSREYKVIIRKTPHVQYQTSIILKIFDALIVVLAVLYVTSTFVGPR